MSIPLPSPRRSGRGVERVGDGRGGQRPAVGHKAERSGRWSRRVKGSVTGYPDGINGIVFALSERRCVWYAAIVITTPESVAFDRGVRPVLQIVLPDKAEAVLSFQADPELQKRIEDLAAKSTEGQLTEEERAEYEGYVRAN